MPAKLSALAARRAREAALAKHHEEHIHVVAPFVEDCEEAKGQTSRKRKRSEGRSLARRPVEEGVQVASTNLQVTNHSRSPASHKPYSQAEVPQAENEDRRLPSGECSPVLRTGPEELSVSVSRSNGHQNSFAFRRSFSIVGVNESDTDTLLVSEKAEKCTVQLGGEDTLRIIGQYDIWVKTGAITIYGAVLRASSKEYRVYAPSTHPVCDIRLRASSYEARQRGALLVIQSCRSRIRLLKNVSSRFRGLWNQPRAGGLTRSLDLTLSSSQYADQQPLRILDIPREWSLWSNYVVGRINVEEAPLLFICGHKDAGKSTLGRFLCNEILTKTGSPHDLKPGERQYADTVAFLDLDPGQPELSPPGQLSLSFVTSPILGPPYTHPITPLQNDSSPTKSLSFGYLSPQENPSHYLDCALDLINVYQKSLREYKRCPLIVNSSGWIHGEGLSVTKDLLRILEVSDVVFLSSQDEENPTTETGDVLDDYCSDHNITLANLPAISPPPSTRKASDLRAMQSQSYFHLTEPENGQLRWNPSPLSQHPPLVIHYSGQKQSLFAVLILGEAINPRFINLVLEGCIVDIVVVEDDLALPPSLRFSDSLTGPFEPSPHALSEDEHASPTGSSLYSSKSSPPRDPLNNIPYIPPSPHHSTTSPLPPSHTHAIGQAMIRSIDPKTQTFHILTPVSSSTLAAAAQEKRIVLVRPKIDAPTWVYEEDVEWEKHLLRQKRTEEGGSVHESEFENEMKGGGEVMEEDERDGEVAGAMQDDGEASSMTARFKALPWAEVLTRGETRGKGARKRSGRRDLKFRPASS